MKKCNGCYVEKDDSEFRKHKMVSGNYKLSYLCKLCAKQKDAERYANESMEDRANRLAKRKEWKESNRHKVRALKKKYRMNRKAIRVSSIPNDAHVKAWELNLDDIARIAARLHDAHVKEWRSDSARIARWRHKNSIEHMLRSKVKHGVYRSLKENAPRSGWSDHLGYTMSELKDHLEKRFIDGMSWDNRDQWHIDHIKPLCSFQITRADSDEFRECFGIQNMRPMWPEDNRAKHWNYDRYLKVG